MKKVIPAILTLAFLLPATSQALSCMDPAGMTQYYADEPHYVIFTGVAGETVEHVKQAASTDGDPNRQFNEGYVGQRVTPTEIFKGSIASDAWIYHQQNSTRGYMCSSGPVTEGEIALFVVSDRGGMFELIDVVNTYDADSETAKAIIAALNESEDQPRIYETTTKSQMLDLAGEIREMIYLVRIKLSEWRWWRSAE